MSDQYSIMSQEELLTVVAERDRRIEELEAELRASQTVGEELLERIAEIERLVHHNADLASLVTKTKDENERLRAALAELISMQHQSEEYRLNSTERARIVLAAVAESDDDT